MQILNEVEVKELWKQAAGHAVSYQDAPLWYCGTRKCTVVIGDDGEYQMSALAYSCRDKCDEFLRLTHSIESAQMTVTDLIAELRRSKGVRRKLAITSSIGIAQRDIFNCRQSQQQLVDKYFRRFERQFLITE